MCAFWQICWSTCASAFKTKSKAHTYQNMYKHKQIDNIKYESILIHNFFHLNVYLYLYIYIYIRYIILEPYTNLIEGHHARSLHAMACENIEIFELAFWSSARILPARSPAVSRVSLTDPGPLSGLTVSSIPSDMVCMNTDVVLQTSHSNRAAMLLVCKLFELS